MHTRGPGEVRDPNQVFDVALGCAGNGVSEKGGRKQGLEIQGFSPLFSSKEDSKLNVTLLAWNLMNERSICHSYIHSSLP